MQELVMMFCKVRDFSCRMNVLLEIGCDSMPEVG